MTDLRLAVKAEYFWQIAYGEKPFEYRARTPYWEKRLVGKQYDTVTITLGYPAAHETHRILTFPYRGYEEQTITHKHFDNKPTDVFAIILGKESK